MIYRQAYTVYRCGVMIYRQAYIISVGCNDTSSGIYSISVGYGTLVNANDGHCCFKLHFPIQKKNLG